MRKSAVIEGMQLLQTLRQYLYIIPFVTTGIILFSTHNSKYDAVTTCDYRNSLERVLLNLYEATGNYVYPTPPQIELNEGSSRVAAYFPRQHKIIVEKKAYEVCQSFGKDSLNALAFIIGHELTHSYQHYHKKLGSPTSYLSFYKTINTSEKIELEADIHGLFNAYVAGYRTFEILPELISRLYEAYNLTNITLDNYPSLKERQQTAGEVSQNVEKLVQLYDGANYFSAIGRYDLTAASLLYISNYYKGKEVLNNLGANQLLQAINFAEKDIDLYLFPIELNWQSRLKKPKTIRGIKELSVEEQAYRLELLNQAKEHLETAKDYDSNHFSSHLNLICLYNLLGDYQMVLDYCQLEKFEKSIYLTEDIERSKALIELVKAIAYANINTSNTRILAKNIWEKLQHHSDEFLAYQATYNLKMLSASKVEIFNQFDCPTSTDLANSIDNISLHRMKFDNGLNLNSEVEINITNTAQSIIYSFFSDNKYFVFQRVQSSQALPTISLNLDKEHLYEMVHTDSGYFLLCEPNTVIYFLDDSGAIKEWGKWWSE